MTSDRDFLDPFLADELTSLVSQAAAAVMDIRASTVAVRLKSDASPVTAADHASEEIIMQGLSRLLPGIMVVSEEASAQSAPQSLSSTFILVDPLDGTREFIAGRDEFTINLAIVVGTRPVLGVVSAPALHGIWRGVVSRGAERLHLAPGAATKAARDKTALNTAVPDREHLRAVVSRSHMDEATAAWLSDKSGLELLSIGSALKFCRVAEGAADIYPRLAPTMEWDVAAGDAVLTAAGGAVTTPEGKPLVYGRIETGLRIPAFIAWGRRDTAAISRT